MMSNITIAMLMDEIKATNRIDHNAFQKVWDKSIRRSWSKSEKNNEEGEVTALWGDIFTSLYQVFVEGK
jgi:hypothetical protein